MSSPATVDLSSLCSEYLNLLASSNPVVGPDTSTASEAAEALLSMFQACKRYSALPPACQELLTNFVCPLANPSAGPSEFMPSPMETPFDDFLSTPQYDDYGPGSIGPLIAECDDFYTPPHDIPLFYDACLFDPPSSSDGYIPPPHFLDDMFPDPLPIPELDDPPLFDPPPPPRPSSRLPTGTRKNVRPEDLIPLSTPIRKNIKPEALTPLPTGTRKNLTSDALTPMPEDEITTSINVGDGHSANTYSPDGRSSQDRTQ